VSRVSPRDGNGEDDVRARTIGWIMALSLCTLDDVHYRPLGQLQEGEDRHDS
jgi:hypothetical protein